MSAHIFVDESKERGFIVAAAVVLPADLDSARRAVRRLILPGQRRIHFHKERDDRRRQVIAAITQLRAEAVVFDASGHRGVKAARDACLTELVGYAAKINAAHLVLELDESTMKSDQRLLYEQARRAGVAEGFRYRHLRAHEESLLAIPDALAWCWTKGGPWRAAVRRMVTESRQI